jgi:alkanesulfonate monooxygenase SsuD/methylene tetrahydromethanopterin reductase-like flavin-dependent oxidoreductase (luciferase family)
VSDVSNAIEWFWGLPGLQRTRVDPKSLVVGYKDLVTYAQQAEQMGFDAIGITEHHFWYDGYCPSLLPVLAGLARQTNRIRLLTNALLIPMHDPLRIAEEVALVDVLSNGRLTLALGIGYRPEEFAGLGWQKRGRGMRAREAIRFLRQALSSEDRFSFHGKFFNYDDVRIVPKPIQKPHPPIWFAAGGAETTAYWTGHAGLNFYAGTASTVEWAKQLRDKYFEGARAAGRDIKTLRIGLVRDVVIAETMEEAKAIVDRELMPVYQEQLIGFGFILDEKGEPLRDLPETHPAYQALLDSFIWGTPEKVMREFEKFVDLGFTTFMTRMFGTVWNMPKQIEMMELFSKRVMPHFRQLGKES